MSSTARQRTVEDKVADWKRAFDAIREEITPAEMRVMMVTLQGVKTAGDIASYVTLARLVCANDRAAATVAALLTTNGVKPVTFGEDSLDGTE